MVITDANNFLLVGTLGSGKSLTGVRIAVHQYLANGMPVYTNLDFYPENFQNSRNKDIRIIRLPDHPTAEDLLALPVGNPTLVKDADGEWSAGEGYDPQKQSLLMLDEGSHFMNTRDFRDKGRASLIEVVTMLRKMGYDTCFLAQHPDMFDKQIRQAIASQVGWCQQVGNMKIPLIGFLVSGFRRIYQLATGRKAKFHLCTFRYGLSESGLVSNRDTFTSKGSLLRYYNTAQKFKPDYDKGTFTYLTPWHLKGRYQSSQKSPLWLVSHYMAVIPFYLSYQLVRLIPAARRWFLPQPMKG